MSALRGRLIVGQSGGPTAVINASAAPVQVVLDSAMMRHDRLNYHPLTNAATTTITATDLLRFLRAQGHEPKMVAL